MKDDKVDFYSKTSLKSYNLNESMRYQLSMLDSLDVFTRVHSENVANITCRICEYLHLDKTFTVYATTCAYLHDIGKLFIPPSILQKPTALTDDEYAVMKTHTTLGYNMCMDDLKLRPYANGTLYHHESLNGTGYPNGVTKKDIPPEGQIIRVADEFDAIVSKRQYKSHVGITDTLKILIEECDPIPKSVALKSMQETTKLGKLNPRYVRALCKVVIDDTEYEITCILDYIKFVKTQIKRLEKAYIIYTKMEKSKSKHKKEHYEQEINYLLEGGETIRNFRVVLEEYRSVLIKKNEVVANLFQEVKNIKKLRV